MNGLFATHGYLAITVVLILTGSGLPIPEEVPIIAAAAFSVGDGPLNPFIALACCLFGAVVGDCIMYWIGYHFGRGVLRKRRWWSRFVTPEREERIEEMFHQHGLKVFFVARFLVALRSPVYLTAGILRVSFKKFVLIDLVCATAVVGSVFGLAYFFGAGIVTWIKRGQWGITIAVVIALACAALFLWRRYRRRKTLPTPPKHLEDVFLPPTKKESPTVPPTEAPKQPPKESKESLTKAKGSARESAANSPNGRTQAKGSLAGEKERTPAPSDNGNGKRANPRQPNGEELHSGESEERAV